jgi:AcrR family transcriptional regulator
MSTAQASLTGAGRGTGPSARQVELLEAAYRYVLEHGLAGMSLRPLATAVGSSPRVLLYLFGSKDALVRALLARARADELRLLDELHASGASGDDEGDDEGETGPPIDVVVERVWAWLAAPRHRALLVLWAEAYARSLVEPDGPWGGFARDTVQDWLAILARAQPESHRNTSAGGAERSALLAVLRGALLDLLATGDQKRTTAAVRHVLRRSEAPPSRAL